MALSFNAEGITGHDAPDEFVGNSRWDQIELTEGDYIDYSAYNEFGRDREAFNGVVESLRALPKGWLADQFSGGEQGKMKTNLRNSADLEWPPSPLEIIQSVVDIDREWAEMNREPTEE